jgi:hypothetical protein
LNVLRHQLYYNQKVLVTTQLATKCFQLPQIGDRKYSVTNHVVIELVFGHHMSTNLGQPIDSGSISTIDLATNFDLVTKYGLPSDKM